MQYFKLKFTTYIRQCTNISISICTSSVFISNKMNTQCTSQNVPPCNCGDTLNDAMKPLFSGPCRSLNSSNGVDVFFTAIKRRISAICLHLLASISDWERNFRDEKISHCWQNLWDFDQSYEKLVKLNEIFYVFFF